VANVFHTVPQLLNGGSGPSTESQDQRLEGDGRHPHRGHLIELVASSSSSDSVTMTSSGVRSPFKSCHDMALI
jgi:hypothetical protein